MDPLSNTPKLAGDPSLHNPPPSLRPPSFGMQNDTPKPPMSSMTPMAPVAQLPKPTLPSLPSTPKPPFASPAFPPVPPRPMTSPSQPLPPLGFAPKPASPSMGIGIKPPTSAPVGAPKKIDQGMLIGQQKISSIPIIEEQKSGASGLKKFFVWGASLAVVVAVGFASYYFVFPLLFPDKSPEPVVQTTPTPIPEPTPESGKIFASHTSLLASSNEIVGAQIPDLNLSALKGVLQQQAQNPRAPQSVLEVTVSDQDRQIASSRVLSLLIPGISPNLFQDDFTVALYYDQNSKAWPIYLFKLSLDTNVSQAQTELRNRLETSSGLGSFFVESPGAPNGTGFKDGSASGVATRYITFSAPGAALNAAWSNDVYIVSTSYEGLRAIISRL